MPKSLDFDVPCRRCAGVAGLTIEDTALPVAYGAAGKTTVISLEEGVGKMRAALAARQDPGLVVDQDCERGPKRSFVRSTVSVEVVKVNAGFAELQHLNCGGPYVDYATWLCRAPSTRKNFLRVTAGRFRS